MIQAKDLRIGNLVLSNNPLYRKDWLGKVLSILEIKDESVSVVAIDELPYAFTGGQFLKYIDPIPLTEELLLKCGFVVIHIDGSDGIFRIYNLGAFTYNTNHGWWYLLDKLRFQITSLHQLQNLYYSLTNTELEINL